MPVVSLCGPRKTSSWDLDNESCFPMVIRGVYNRCLLELGQRHLISDLVASQKSFSESVEIEEKDCCMLLAISGAGVIVDSPVMPTIKVVSASRCKILGSSIDLNPEFIDVSDALGVVINIANGRPTVGETMATVGVHRPRSVSGLHGELSRLTRTGFREPPLTVLLPSTLCESLLQTCWGIAWELNKTITDGCPVVCLPSGNCHSEHGRRQFEELAWGLAQSAAAHGSMVVLLAHASCSSATVSLEAMLRGRMEGDATFMANLKTVYVSDDVLRTTLDV